MDSPTRQPGRDVLEGTISVFLAEALLIPTGIFTVAFLTRRLGPANYGLFALAASLVAWLEWGVASAFARATIRFVGTTDDWRPVGATVLRLHLAASVGAALVLWVLAEPIASLLNERMLVGYLRLFALDIPVFSLAQAHRQVLVGIGGFRQRALAGAGHWTARMLFIIILVELGLSVPGAILGSIGASVVNLAIGRFYVRPALRHHSALPVRRLWGYAVPLSLWGVSMRLYDKLDLFALKWLGGTAADAGIYGAAQNVAVALGIFPLAFAPILLSTLSRTLRGGSSHRARALSRNAMRSVIALIPLAGMTAGAAPEIAGLVFGEDFLPAAPLLGLLVLAGLSLAMISVCTSILTAAGKPGWAFALAGPLVPLAVMGHVLLIPRFGSLGAALVTALFASLGAAGQIMAIRRVWGVAPPIATAWRSALLCVVAYVLAALWPTPGVLLLLKLPAIGLTVGLLFLLLGEFTAGEIDLVRSMLRWRPMCD